MLIFGGRWLFVWVWPLGTDIEDVNIGEEVPCGDWGVSGVRGQLWGRFGTDIGDVNIEGG